MNCNICSVNLTGVDYSNNKKVFVDLAQFPFAALLHSLKSTHPLVAIISLPFVALIYAVKKITRKPFNTPLFTNKDPKLHLLKLETFRELHKRSFQKVAFFLEQNGFEPFVTLEDKSMVQAIFEDVWISRQQKIYATIHIKKATGKVLYTTFSAFTSGNTYLSVDNTYAIPITYPKNLVVQHLPNAPLGTIFQQLLHLLQKNRETPKILSLKSLLTIGTKIRRFSLEQGLKQKLLYTTREGNPAVTTCYQHPVDVAVRTCAVCHMHLCEACYESFQDRYYCKSCLPKGGKETCQPIVAADGPNEGFAGFGIRTVAWLLDGVAIGMITAAIYMGLKFSITVLAPQQMYASLPFILTQFLFMALVPFYFIVPVKQYGQTLGMRMLGLRVVDQQGRRPDAVAAVVRFAYFLLSCLFVFPLLGYLLVIFRKTKQGFHDQLANTRVVTNHPIRKALFSWSMLLIVFVIAGGYTLKWAKPWMDIICSFSPDAVVSEVTLEASWVLPFEDEHQFLHSLVLREEQMISTSSTTAEALDIRDGTKIWRNSSLAGCTIQGFSINALLPLLMLQYGENEFPQLLNVDSESGEIVWKRQLGISDPSLIYDSQTILVYNTNLVCAYETTNKLLWQKSFSDNFDIEFVALNDNILISGYSDTSRRLLYLCRESGDILWETPNSQYNPGVSLGQGYQCLYTNDGRLNLMFLPEQRVVWKYPQRVGYVVAPLNVSASALNEIPPVLYTTTAAVSSKDGSMLFAYPAGARFQCLSDDFLILIKGNAANNAEDSAGGMLVLDKRIGLNHKAFGGNAWLSVRYVTEDETNIYLAANRKSDQDKAFRTLSELLILNKHTYELERIELGKNLALHQISLFPRQDLVFIPTYQHVGTYKLHRKIEHLASQ